MSIDPTPELRVNIRAALLALSLIMAATMVGTGYNTWVHKSAAYERNHLREHMSELEIKQASDAKRLDGRIDYLRRVTNKRLDNLEAQRAAK